MKPPTETLPDPWLFDSEALLRELARIRELMQQVPITNANATHFGLQIAINANWNLEENLRYILHLHCEQQRAIRRQHEQSLTDALQTANASTKQKIVRLHQSAPSNGHALKNVKSRAASRREAIAKRRHPPFSNSNSANKVA